MHNTTIGSAVQAASSTGTFTLTATDGGLFALYGISLNANSTSAQDVTFSGTTADGQPVSYPFTVTPSTGFAYFRFPTTFTALSSVSWTPGVTLATNIVVTELFPNVPAGPGPGSVAATSGSAMAVTVDTTNLYIDGTHQVVSEPHGNLGPGNYFGGTFNGTPWYAYHLSSVAYYVFQGDLYLPTGSSVTVSGKYPADFIVGNNAIIGSGVTINASAVGTTPGPGGGGEGTQGAGGGGRRPTVAARGGGGYGGGGFGRRGRKPYKYSTYLDNRRYRLGFGRL